MGAWGWGWHTSGTAGATSAEELRAGWGMYVQSASLLQKPECSSLKGMGAALCKSQQAHLGVPAEAKGEA